MPRTSLRSPRQPGAGGGSGLTTWEWQPGAARPLVQTESGRPADECGQDEVDRRFYAIISDLVGTPTHLVDAEGRVAWRSNTSLWGAPFAPFAPTGDGTTYPLRFPGQFHDAETGLHYNYQRYFDPETARYQSPDPLGLAPAPNHHGYVQNPLTWSDPMGLAPCEIFYRVMSAKEFGGLGPLGEITVKGTENFVTQEAGYVRRIAETFARRRGRNAEKYTHLVRYQMQPGTRDALIAAARGSGDNIETIREAYGLHLDEIGQSIDFVHLKLEREGLNFGLRPGSVDVFNSRILGKIHTLL